MTPTFSLLRLNFLGSLQRLVTFSLLSQLAACGRRGALWAQPTLKKSVRKWPDRRVADGIIIT